MQLSLLNLFVGHSAVTVFAVFGSLLLCSILPSNVAFTSLVSAGAGAPPSVNLLMSDWPLTLSAICLSVPTISAYALIPICRAFISRSRFQNTKFSLGRLALPAYAVAAAFNLLLFAVLISPFGWPVSAATFNVRGFLCRLRILTSY